MIVNGNLVRMCEKIKGTTLSPVCKGYETIQISDGQTGLCAEPEA